MASHTVQVKVLPLISESRLHPDDTQVGGLYELLVSDQVHHHLLADAALDIFHGAVAIENLDDFSFEVWQEGKQLPAGTSEEDYTFVDKGKVVSGPWASLEDSQVHTEVD